jgi:uncharacterized alpha-E superfamily protein
VSSAVEQFAAPEVTSQLVEVGEALNLDALRPQSVRLVLDRLHRRVESVGEADGRHGMRPLQRAG